MKLLYLTFQEDAPLYMGVTRKIAGQSRAFEELGYIVTYTLWNGLNFNFYSGDKVETVKIPGGRGLMRQFENAVRTYLASRNFDVVYMRLDRISFGAVSLCRLAKERGASRVIIEIPNYPYLKDYIRNIKDAKSAPRRVISSAKVLATAVADRLSGLCLHSAVDAAVLIGDKSDSFFGVKAINISNGISSREFSSVHRNDADGEIVLVGVAGTLWWQAYDRVLAGMSAYMQKKLPRDPPVRFILVGGDEKEMPAFLSQVKKYGLENNVECPGFKKGKPLLDIYGRADVGVSSLGCYRRGLTHCSSLKAREYCAAGIPFLYAYEDEALQNDASFALKLPNDSTPVDMEKVVKFAEHCRADPTISKAEKEFADKNYDWKFIMKRVLSFAGVTINNIFGG